MAGKMKTIVCFYVVALCVSVSLAQITFTREWVKGKRSTSANAAALGKDGHSLCRGLVSAVEYLIELEKMRKVECSECCHSSGLPVATYPVLPDIQRTPSDFIPFLRELPGGGASPLVYQDQAERLPLSSSSASNSDRRNQ